MVKASAKYSRMRGASRATVTATNIGVSLRSGSNIDGYILQVSHVHYGLTDPVTGMKAKFRKADCDGMVFPTSKDAWDFALERGYIKIYR